MSVKTKITLEEINFLSKDIKKEFICIENSFSGISDSVFILTSNKNIKYVLKLYENSNVKKVKKELEILKNLDFLNIAKPLYFFEEYEKPLVLYSFIDGVSPKNIDKNNLKEIAIFLKSLHSVKIEELSSSTYLSLERLLNELLNIKDLDEKTKEEFLVRVKKFKKIDLNINQAIIHGDIFPDNTKFYKNKLIGVYDFSEVCISNKYIDLAIVINSWCFKDNFMPNLALINEFLNTYDKNLTLDFMEKYLLYVNLYYALKRYINLHKNLFIKKVSYKEYLKKFDNTYYRLKKEREKWN